MKVLFLGDSHGYLNEVTDALIYARDNDARFVISVGDFGYWEHTKEGKLFLDTVSSAAGQNGIDVFFVDGNHENFDLLANYRNEPCYLENLPHCDFTECNSIRPNIHHIARGTCLTINRITMMGFGGSWSIDRHLREEGKSWWPQEQPTDEDLAHAKANSEGRNIDLLITHDTVDEADLSILLSRPNGSMKDPYPEARVPRLKVSELVQHVKPTALIHGHYHRRAYYEIRYDDFTLSCLGLDKTTKIKSTNPEHRYPHPNNAYFILDTTQALESLYT